MLGHFAFLLGQKADLGVQKAKKQILLLPKEQKSKNAYALAKKANKAKKQKVCYFAIWLFSLFRFLWAKKQKKSMIPYFDKLISYLAIWLISLSDSKKQNPTLLLYYEMLFGYLANWPN